MVAANAVIVEKEARELEKRKIGSLDVTVAGLGCNNFGWRIDAAATVPVVNAAIEAGINFFDTADVYDQGNSEEFLSRALGGRRKDVIVATKFRGKMGEGKEGARPEYIRQAVEDSLRRLQTDYIDLYQLHRPDPNVPIADTLGALDELVKAGRVREIGASNFTVEQIREAEAATPKGAARFVSVQNEYSILHREPEGGEIAECQRFGIALIPYFPLANGLLTGKYRSGQPSPKGSRGDAGWGPKVFTEENLAIAGKLAEFAESQGHTLLELAFSWLLAQTMVASVIAGASRPDQVRANAAAVNWKLTPGDLQQVEKILGK
jgi:aryl-alcohol dehydrogenase-like predicted oxidoreductase